MTDGYDKLYLLLPYLGRLWTLAVPEIINMRLPPTEFDSPWKDILERYFAEFIAHLKAQERLTSKLYLTRRLYEQGYERVDIIALFKFVDWIMSLPEELEQELWREIQRIEEDRRMPYITSVERIGMARGFAQGMQQGMQQGLEQSQQQVRQVLLASLELALELKFGAEGLSLLPEIAVLEDIEQLKVIHSQLRTVATVTELRQIYQPLLG